MDDGTIATERLILRRVTGEDWPFFESLWRELSKAPSARWDAPGPETRERAMRLVKTMAAEDGHYLIATGATPVGCAGLVGDARLAELSFSVHPRWQRRGYAREACAALVDRGFREGLQGIWARTSADNLPSVRTLCALGFVCVQREMYWLYRDETGAPIWFTCETYLIKHPTHQMRIAP